MTEGSGHIVHRQARLDSTPYGGDAGLVVECVADKVYENWTSAEKPREGTLESLVPKNCTLSGPMVDVT